MTTEVVSRFMVVERYRTRSEILASGPRAGHTLNHARELTVDALKRLGDVAASYETKLALKTLPLPSGRTWTFLNTLESALELIDSCGNSAVGLSIDSLQLHQEVEIQKLLPEVITQIAAVQITDFFPEMDSRSSFGGYEMLELLDDAGYQGYFDLELWSEQIWQSDYTQLLSRIQLACQDEPSSQFS